MIFLISSSKNALLDSTLKTESAADAQLVVLLGWWVGVEFNAPLDTIGLGHFGGGLHSQSLD